MADTEQLDRLTHTLTERAPDYGVELSAEAIQTLVAYYALLEHWNRRLHLMAPCEPEEVATRHLLESLLLLRFLPEAATVIDIGSGAGLPIIPCLIARADLSATLVESSQKKSVFLREALNQLGLSQRGRVVAKQFEEVNPHDESFVTCRALDQFINKVPTLLKWAPAASTLLLFGGVRLRQQLDNTSAYYREFLIPFSEKRFLFEVKQNQ